MFYFVFYLFMPFFNIYYLIYNREIYKTILLFNIAMAIVSASVFLEIITLISTHNNRLNIN